MGRAKYNIDHHDDNHHNGPQSNGEDFRQP